MTVRNAESMAGYGSAWQAKGYTGGGSVGSLIDSLSGRSAVVVGSADGVFDELAAALKQLENPVIFGVNDIGMYLPRLDHWVSLHHDKLRAWRDVRWQDTHDKEETKYHSIDRRPYIDHCWESLTPLFALSGYFAMQIAYLMGCRPIVLCGCPGEARRRFFEGGPDLGRRLGCTWDFQYGQDPNGAGRGVLEQVEGEMNRLPDFKASVRSCSGFTQRFFGGL